MSSAHLARYAPLQEMAKEYIAEHRVQQMFSSLLSALVMHRPEDPIAFIQMKLDEVGHCNLNQSIGYHDYL